MENKQSLYDINEEQRKLIYEIEYMEGELTEEMQEKLALNESNLKQKSIAYLEVISTKESFNSMIDAEIKRLQQMKKVNTNVVERLKDNLLNAVRTFGEFTVGLTKFSTRKSTSVEVDDFAINMLPKEFKTVKITETADKRALKKALDEGKEFEGVRLVHNDNLKIN